MQDDDDDDDDWDENRRREKQSAWRGKPDPMRSLEKERTSNTRHR